MRSVGFILLPFYTRHLTRHDYGILAVTSIVTQILSIIFPLGLTGAVTRFYFEADSEESRKRTNGTIWLTIFVFSLVSTSALDQTGQYFSHALFPSTPFYPYIRIAIWAAFCNAISQLPLIIFQVQERPKAYILLVIIGQLLTISLIGSFILAQRKGAQSYLTGHLCAMMLLNLPYLYITFRHVSLKIDWGILKTGLMFGLPLIPHSLASWSLDFADRVILEKLVSLDDLGLYSISYLFGSLMSLIAISINNSWVPFFYREFEKQGAKEQRDRRLAKLITFYILGLVFIALTQLLFIKELLVVFTEKSFHSAEKIAYWVIIGQLFNGIALIPANFLMLHKKTRLLPFITVLSVILNITINLLFVPEYGVIVAAWATLISYAFMLIAIWIVSVRISKFTYEYRRIFQILVSALLVVILSSWASFDQSYIRFTLNLVLLLVLPLILWVSGFLERTEKTMIEQQFKILVIKAGFR